MFDSNCIMLSNISIILFEGYQKCITFIVYYLFYFIDLICFNNKTNMIK